MLRDHIDNFDLSDEVLSKHHNEAMAIDYLFAGLEYLYGMVREAEKHAAKAFLGLPGSAENENGSVTETVPPSVRVCAFHWYATTACNLLRMIGWIRQAEDPQADGPVAYLENVLPAVKRWRDKVSAHFVRHSPHWTDTPADELASLIPPTALVNGRYVAGAYRVVVKRSGQASESQIKPWSLTEVHEELRARFGMKSE